MFDIGMSELLIIGVVALIVVGPKDLPGMFRTLGRFTAKIKAMGREFSRAMDNAADEAGVNEIKDSLNAAANPKKFGLDKLKEAATDFENWDPMKSGDTKVPAKPEMTEDRAAVAKQISEATAAKATARKSAEGAEVSAEVPADTAKAAAKAPAKKAPAQKPAAKKSTAQKTAAKSATSKAAAQTKTQTKTKAAGRKSAVKKTATSKPKAAQKSAPKTKKEGDA